MAGLGLAMGETQTRDLSITYLML